MNVAYQITGYDKRTERLVMEIDVPQNIISAVMDVANVTPEQAADFGSIPLDAAAVKTIGRKLNKNIYSEFYDWFLEPFAVSELA